MASGYADITGNPLPILRSMSCSGTLEQHISLLNIGGHGICCLPVTLIIINVLFLVFVSHFIFLIDLNEGVDWI